MYDYMKALYYRFTTTPEHVRAMEQELCQIHKQLSELLEKREKKLLLRLMDLEEDIRNQECLNGFISGYRLSCGIQQELVANQTQYNFDDDDENHALEIMRKEKSRPADD